MCQDRKTGGYDVIQHEHASRQHVSKQTLLNPKARRFDTRVVLEFALVVGNR